MAIRGSQAFIEMLSAAGVRYLFGNPGTTELPLMDALAADERIEFILGLQEVPVMGMADGYAMASGRLGVVNLHICAGLGNATGMLYNAWREGTPLLITAGQQDRRLRFEEPILWGDMLGVVRPWTKWAAEIERIEDLPAALRRAMQTALSPPTGPVFLSIPMDVQMAEADLDLTLSATPNPEFRPAAEAVSKAVEVLLAAKRPAILVGSRVVERSAVAELVAVAEQLGAPVFSEPGTTHGRLSFPADHPLYAQGLPLWSPELRERLVEFDALLVVGMDLFRQYVYHEPSRAMPEQIRIVHLDEDQYQLGKNYPLAVALWGGTKSGLAELDAVLTQRMTREQMAAARKRAEQLGQAHRAARGVLVRQAESERAARPMTPLAAMAAIARVLPDNVAVVEEAVTTTNTTFERLGALKNTSGYFGHRGWGLGWGLGCAIGVRLAWPDRSVLALLGDGAALYGIQGLWTAARYKIPVTFVICNNAQYQILKIGAVNMGLEQAGQGRFVGMDIAEPEVDFVGLSESLGVRAERITEPDQLSELVDASLRSDEPHLFDVQISKELPGRLNYG
ncbi:MAG TPA: thiamine pyrophosphate-binding protein [Pirellulales bacterium]|jgi:benzoylformate decarboxylase|nr:thiamine pyrophosphate-binding protein [Pirellulales bacterium]